MTNPLVEQMTLLYCSQAHFSIQLPDRSTRLPGKGFHHQMFWEKYLGSSPFFLPITFPEALLAFEYRPNGSSI
jgi:hypothetical protein